MYLSSFSLIEPEDKFYFYQPSWLNAWESHLFNKALKSTHANGWGLKRFGTQPELYAGEMIRNPQYQKYRMRWSKRRMTRSWRCRRKSE